ncbi:MAG TPA: hypothetical protein VIP53_00025 [Nitrososphaera sp.]
MWTVDEATSGFQTMIGPKDQRVLVVSKINPNATSEEISAGNYTEQVVWRNMLTGDPLAQSEFTEPMITNGLITSGYGGRVYYETNNGFIVYYVTTLDSTKSTRESD